MRTHPLLRIGLILLAAWLGNLHSEAQWITQVTAVDVGEPFPAGSTLVNGPGSFTVAGAGEYKNSATDDFHFAYINATGNFDYQVRVESLEVPSQWSKAGLMARETAEDLVAVDVGSRAICMTAYPPGPSGGNTLILIRREQAYTATADDILGTTPAYPNAWLRLRRFGDTMIGYTGTNGVNWDVQGVRNSASWPDGPLSQNLLVGLAVASARNESTVKAECRDFGAVPSTTPVAFAVPLAPVTVNQGRRAVFSVAMSGYDPFYAQWFTNGVPIPGGTNFSFGNTLSYTNAPLSLSDHNTVFSVVVSNAFSSVTSANVLLHVLDDSTPPAVTAATTDSGGIDVLFSEEVVPATALARNNYTLQGAGVDILDIALSSNNQLAFLTLSDAITSTNATLRVTRIQDLVGNAATSTVPLWHLLPADNIVASGYPSTREAAFTSVTDGFVDAGWQTLGDRDHRPQFAGLIYSNVQTFAVIKVDLGEQTIYGGSFAEMPRLYLLRKQVDTDLTGPETDPANWEPVEARLASPNLFDANVDPNPSPASPIVFDLTALDSSVRAGYGWAVGGVNGDDSGFIRLSELRAFGQSGGVIVERAPTLSVARPAASTILISWPAASPGFILKSSPSLASATWTAVTEPTVTIGNNSTVAVAFSSGTRFFRLEK